MDTTRTPDGDAPPDDETLGGAWRGGEMDDDIPQEPAAYRGLPILGETDQADGRREWIVEGVFARGETSLLIAPPFGGKSALIAHIGAHIATGAAWFGRKIENAGPVLIVAGERARETRRRLEALAVDIGPHRCRVANAAGLDLRRRDAVDRIRETLGMLDNRLGPPVAIVFDTLASLTPGADELSASDMTRALAAISSIRDEFDLHAMVAHHSPRDNPRQSRGHSSVDGAADLVLCIERGKAAGALRWRVTAANALAEPFPAGEFGIASQSLAGASVAIVRPADAIAALPERDAAVLAALRAGAGSPIIVADLTRTIEHPSFADLDSDARRKAVDRSLRNLADAGRAVLAGEGRGRTARPAEGQP